MVAGKHGDSTWGVFTHTTHNNNVLHRVDRSLREKEREREREREREGERETETE